MTETFTSQQAADLLGVNAQKFHRLVHQHEVVPMIEAPGIRGAKFWRRSDIERIKTKLDQAMAS